MKSYKVPHRCWWPSCDRSAVLVVVAGPTGIYPTCKRCCGVIIGTVAGTDGAWVRTLRTWLAAKHRAEATSLNGQRAA